MCKAKNINVGLCKKQGQEKKPGKAWAAGNFRLGLAVPKKKWKEKATSYEISTHHLGALPTKPEHSRTLTQPILHVSHKPPPTPLPNSILHWCGRPKPEETREYTVRSGIFSILKCSRPG
eukprot:c1593_g1_i1.p2 GENE.c1593_g1_i1~~c1593_g1_i1.p2  ORF type:complete len:120 (-),score=8.13 c1593_g1_i1:69-428(-)